ncbi:GSH-induced LITAF domain protein-like [Triticum dicoccoides]|nr:GSH-induced LITAF domain protein-like [Triticum dicoccoides]XP_044460120.1 GSH-induced LITAF domain protein-like [Triticum aestivum]
MEGGRTDRVLFQHGEELSFTTPGYILSRLSVPSSSPLIKPRRACHRTAQKADPPTTTGDRAPPGPDLRPPAATMATAKAAGEEPALGIPYNPAQAQGSYYYPPDPYAAGRVPPNAIYAGAPKGVPLQHTMFRDTPAPFHCQSCGDAAVTSVRSKPSVASVVACMMPFFLGVCFLCPSMDCLWHKQHYCPSCGEMVAEFKKDDPCIVIDPTSWTEPSFAVPA